MMFSRLKDTYLDVQKYHQEDADAASIERNRYYIYYVMRPLSIPFTIFSRWIGLTPNQATLLGNIFILISTILLLSGSQNTIAVVILYNLYCIFDHVDGNLARLGNSSSSFGKYYDGLSDHLPQKPFIMSLGVYAFYLYGEILWVIIAFLSIFIEELYVYVESRFNIIKLTSQNNTQELKHVESIRSNPDKGSGIKAAYRMMLKNRNIINFPVFSVLFLINELAFYLLIFICSQLFFFLPRTVNTFLQAKKELT